MSARAGVQAFFRCISVVVVVPLSACSLFSAPDIGDLAFVDVELISAARTPGARPLKVTFTSNVDWADLSGRFSAVDLYKQESLCPFGTGTTLATYSDIYEVYEGGITPVSDLGSAYRRFPNRARAQPTNGLYFYQFFFDAVRKPHQPGAPFAHEWELEPYDLLQNPQDVCVEITGGIYFGPKVTPKVFIVPGKAIEDAYRRAPPIADHKL